jgi:hypothetical protein
VKQVRNSQLAASDCSEESFHLFRMDRMHCKQSPETSHAFFQAVLCVAPEVCPDSFHTLLVETQPFINAQSDSERNAARSQHDAAWNKVVECMEEKDKEQQAVQKKYPHLFPWYKQMGPL